MLIKSLSKSYGREMTDMIWRHLEYENDTFAFEVSNDENVFGLKKNRGVEYALNVTKDLHSVFATVEGYRTVSISWLANKYDYFIETLDKFILECDQHGITSHFNNLHRKFENMASDPSEPQVLTMEILSAGFWVWFSTVIIACFVFILEHIFAAFQRKMKFEKVQEFKQNR